MKKRRVEQFLFYEYAAIADHLGRMAAAGWRLEKIGAFCWTYVQAEPAELTYAVTYFDGASEFDPGPGEAQQTYMDYCRQAGWEPVCRWAQLQIFVTDRPDPVPLETEEPVKLENIHRAMKKNFLPSGYLLLGVAALQLAMQGSNLLRDPADWLSNGLMQAVALLWAALAAYMIWNLASYGRWRRRSRAAVEAGGACLPGRHQGRRAVNGALWAVVAVSGGMMLWSAACRGMGGALAWGMGYMALIIAATLGVKAGLKRLGVSAKVNRAVTMGTAFLLAFGLMGLTLWGIFHSGLRREAPETYTVNGYTWRVYQDQLPLRVEDLMETDYEHYSYEWEENASFLATRSIGRQGAFPDGERALTMEYEITELRVPFLYGLCLRGYQNLESWNDGVSGWEGDTPFFRYEPIDPAPWGVDAAYQMMEGEVPWERWILCRGNRLAKLDLDWEPDPEQMAVIGETLTK